MFTREKCFNNKTCHYLKKTPFCSNSAFILLLIIQSLFLKEKKRTTQKIVDSAYIILLQRFNKPSAIKDKVMKQS